MIEFDRRLEDFLDMRLEDMSFEDFLEEIGWTPNQVLLHMYYTGLVDNDDLEQAGFNV